MAARRFFIEGTRALGETAEITGGDAHKIVNVLRLGRQDRIELVDSAGMLFGASISGIAGGVVGVTLLERLAEPDPLVDAAHGLHVEVAQAVPKGQRLDFVVEKATELGVAAIVPFYSQRSVARGVPAARLQRWRRLAKIAAQQCGRLTLPAISDPLPFEILLTHFSEYDVVLFAWELAPRIPLRDALPPLLEGKRRALIVVGPEGGFAHGEADAATQHGAHLLWLGARILRTDTAALALLAVIDALIQPVSRPGGLLA